MIKVPISYQQIVVLSLKMMDEYRHIQNSPDNSPENVLEAEAFYEDWREINYVAINRQTFNDYMKSLILEEACNDSIKNLKTPNDDWVLDYPQPEK